MGCTANDLVTALKAAAATIEEHRVELIQLDRVIGDGDHGENMDRGFKAVLTALDANTPDTPAAVLKLVATTLISKVGGAAGPLYGTAFLRASTAVKDRAELEPADLTEALTAALGGIVARGKAEPGDKTMVDALDPAVRAAKGDTATELLAAAAAAAETGADATVPLVARKGRASYLGERSAGHMDPGARSTALLLRAFAEVAAR
ncbi:dihydroxyacetone kinase subunit DhaL [Actinophytocola algeriensis]|uniref:Dihydroxyacetone kinase-like protein n=1 Tax=Actinophytocola algeriensis TaxID=1768010 RepID=A0A7W7Q644_9PSEU|nr:dihydroxyacetone kinase subunit DhaL [Actinophytocola algeriensis]MBB4907523.1 dihydroxyacetone kinase-like protein [Actinophytocola algeriensis]MBE1479553.1 dihydroxyacetone kinase-like protein [Actinophytocola algeriensis]